MESPDRAALLSRIAELETENAALAEEKRDLEMLMEMSADHADGVGEELLNRANTFKEMSNLILESVPIPILVTRRSDSQVLYLNPPCGKLFGQPRETLMDQKATSFLYRDPGDRQTILNALEKDGAVDDLEIEGKRADGRHFAVRVFSRPMSFEGQPCVLTSLYDETDRKQAEKEIARLHAELEQKKREVRRYLVFTLFGNRFGIRLPSIREISGMVPISRIPDAPDGLKGVIHLRNSVLPVYDLGELLGLGSVQQTEKTCIIIVEIGEKNRAGMIVESVSEVQSVRGRDIDDLPPGAGFDDIHGLFKAARTGDDLFVIVDVQRIFSKGTADKAMASAMG